MLRIKSRMNQAFQNLEERKRSLVNNKRAKRKKKTLFSDSDVLISTREDSLFKGLLDLDKNSFQAKEILNKLKERRENHLTKFWDPFLKHHKASETSFINLDALSDLEDYQTYNEIVSELENFEDLKEQR